MSDDKIKGVAKFVSKVLCEIGKVGNDCFTCKCSVVPTDHEDVIISPSEANAVQSCHFNFNE